MLFARSLFPSNRHLRLLVCLLLLSAEFLRRPRFPLLPFQAQGQVMGPHFVKL